MDFQTDFPISYDLVWVFSSTSRPISTYPYRGQESNRSNWFPSCTNKEKHFAGHGLDNERRSAFSCHSTRQESEGLIQEASLSSMLGSAGGGCRETSGPVLRELCCGSPIDNPHTLFLHLQNNKRYRKDTKELKSCAISINRDYEYTQL